LRQAGFEEASSEEESMGDYGLISSCCFFGGCCCCTTTMWMGISVCGVYVHLCVFVLHCDRRKNSGTPPKSTENMSLEVDLTGDGGVLKKILRESKPGALRPCENLPNVDGKPIIY
jgi:hypothetical protein